MEIFVVAALASGIVFLAGSLLAHNLRYKALATLNRKYASFLMLMLAFLLLCDLLAGEGTGKRMPVDMLLALMPMTFLSNTFVTLSQKRVVFSLSLSLSGLLTLYYVLCFCGLLELPSDDMLRLMAVTVAILYLFIYAWVVFYKLYDIHALMQSGTVWTVFCLSVDFMYSVVMLVLVSLYSATVSLPPVCLVVDILLVLLVFALGIRIKDDSVLVLFRKHERRIVESMRISPVDPSASGVTEDNVYRELFERIQEYFDEEKPFLNGNLTINDIVTKVFSNKVYISRAIVQCTGRNFCQYVNYHRIMYAMECFRKNTELKISELWPLCGFNTIVSFNMAFRLFMDENPSEWCRKEKIRLSKKRK